MIDFSNGSVFKLNPCSQEEIVSQVAPILIPGEQVSPASPRPLIGYLRMLFS